jgi:hypothetical protein
MNENLVKKDENNMVVFVSTSVFYTHTTLQTPIKKGLRVFIPVDP